MVSTRSSTVAGPSSDPNRIIVIVTGANAGAGLGICQRLLSALSWPPGYPAPEFQPQRTALGPSMSDMPIDLPYIPVEAGSIPHSLTLIMACRNSQQSEVVKGELYEEHLKLLKKRKAIGYPAPDNWLEDLRIEVEPVDFDSLEGKTGTLAFCERIKEKYSHITTIYANVGLFAATGLRIHLLPYAVWKYGILAFAEETHSWTSEDKGRLSRDNQRGAVWGINVLGVYTLVTELMPLLRSSPSNLPISPRVIYTTSGTTRITALAKDGGPTDAQLLTYEHSYPASKCLGEIVVDSLDEKYGSDGQKGKQSVRCLSAGPGCFYSKNGRAAYANMGFLRIMFDIGYIFMFTMLRLLGSPHHPKDLADAASAIVYSALVADKFLPAQKSAEKGKLVPHSHPIKAATVDYRDSSFLELPSTKEILEIQIKTCESVKGEAKRREGLE